MAGAGFPGRPRPAGRYLSGLCAAALGLCAAGWLVLTPFAFGYRGRSHKAALTDLATGGGLALVCLITLIAWAVAWRRSLRADGVLTRRDRARRRRERDRAANAAADPDQVLATLRTMLEPLLTQPALTAGPATAETVPAESAAVEGAAAGTAVPREPVPSGVTPSEVAPAAEPVPATGLTAEAEPAADEPGADEPAPVVEPAWTGRPGRPEPTRMAGPDRGAESSAFGHLPAAAFPGTALQGTALTGTGLTGTGLTGTVPAGAVIPEPRDGAGRSGGIAVIESLLAGSELIPGFEEEETW